MGKKSGRGGEKKQQHAAEEEARVSVLRVAMHCQCNGCADKIRTAVKDLTLHSGVEMVDQSALASKGEVRLVATADPERLRQRVRKATGKAVDLFLPKEPKAADKQHAADKQQADAAAVQALLLNSLPAHYGQQQAAAWANQLRAGGWNAQGANYGGGYGAAQAYPWAVQQQVAADPYASAAYPATAYSGAYPAAGGAWGPYAAYAAAPQGYGGAWAGYN